MLFSDLLTFFFPRACPGCGHRLAREEGYVCPKCMAILPLEQDYDWRGNSRVLQWLEHEAVVRAGAFAHYERDNVAAQIIHALKYGRHHELGSWMGRWAAQTLLPTGLFEEVDALVPIPLTRSRQHWRGFNQAEKIADGMAEVLGLEVRTDVLRRVADRESQTHFPIAHRRRDMSDVFALQAPTDVEGRHLMLVDDVMTTGTTMLGAIQTLERVSGIRLSAFAWAWTYQPPHRPSE